MVSSEVDEYLAQFDELTKSALQRVREIILSAIPDAEEAISYKIIGFKFDGKYILYISGWKNHCSIHGTSKVLVKHLQDTYPGQLKLSGTTLQFDPAAPPSEDLIRDLVDRRIRLYLQG